MNSDQIWSQKWTGEYQRKQKMNRSMQYPAETLVRIFKGDYIGLFPSSYDGLDVLDIGGGDGNNLAFLQQLGFKAHGTEINTFLTRRLTRKLKARKVTAVTRVGHNDDLPFPDGKFDFLVSWNVIHYCGSRAWMERNIKEYSRVLKPGGFLVLSTMAPGHKHLQESRKVAPNIYVIKYHRDIRDRQRMFCFETQSGLKRSFAPLFNVVKAGRNFTDLMGLDFFILVAQRKRDEKK